MYTVHFVCGQTPETTTYTALEKEYKSAHYAIKKAREAAKGIGVRNAFVVWHKLNGSAIIYSTKVVKQNG